MSNRYGPRIVTDGLVLCLDAADNNSYPGSGTTWTDLSGNGNNGTLTNGPTFNSANRGGIVFDGTNDYIYRSASINLGVYFTIQSWVKINRYGGGPGWNRAPIVSNSYPYSTNQGFLIIASSQNASAGQAATVGYEHFFISIGNDQYYATSTFGSLSNYVSKWVNLTVSVNSTSLIRLYINGIETTYAGQTNGPASLNYTTNTFFLGARDLTSEFLDGSIANSILYNRTLSASEILQNYNATKGRFNP